MLFDFDLNSRMLVHKISLRHNKHKVSLHKLVQTFARHNPNVLLHFAGIYHSRSTLERIGNTSIEKNQDRIAAVVHLNLILNEKKTKFVKRMFEKIRKNQSCLTTTIARAMLVFFFRSITNRELNDIVNELFRYFPEQMNRFSLIVEARE
jgi:hypothetical protein